MYWEVSVIADIFRYVIFEDIKYFALWLYNESELLKFVFIVAVTLFFAKRDKSG